MMLRRFVPEEYQQIFDYISPAAFKVVDWKSAVVQFARMSRQALDKEFRANIIGDLQPHLAPGVILTVDSAESTGNGTAAVDPDAAAGLGSDILDIYFSQFFCKSGIFLDLRQKHFLRSEGRLSWTPSTFIHVFQPEFVNGMLSLYEGYYFDKPGALQAGMLKTRLLVRPDPVLEKELKELLFAHFGGADAKNVVFNLEHFRSSFHELFVFLKKTGVQLPADFLFLGVYLVTLYTALSEPKVSLNVKECVTRVWQRNKALGDYI